MSRWSKSSWIMPSSRMTTMTMMTEKSNTTRIALQDDPPVHDKRTPRTGTALAAMAPMDMPTRSNSTMITPTCTSARNVARSTSIPIASGSIAGCTRSTGRVLLASCYQSINRCSSWKLPPFFWAWMKRDKETRIQSSACSPNNVEPLPTLSDPTLAPQQLKPPPPHRPLVRLPPQSSLCHHLWKTVTARVVARLPSRYTKVTFRY
ncbi:hypothetical protein B0O80DRAFT_462679 [Mortierella sp. GBAus27b]|nr:hypothetical protein B0O80DRAFT_462679 [Mortierella sp. GBAus27b]